MYKIIRHFFSSGRKVTIKKVALEDEAQDHCRNPESSSSTARSAVARARTRRYGPWYDGYTKCKR